MSRPVALITGCRSGFGLVSAVSAAKAGYVVYAGLRDLSTAGDLRAEAGDLPVHPIQLDVTRADEREAVIGRVLDEQGRLDGLVNNAGVALGGFLEQVDEDEFRRLMDVNLFGVFSLTNAALPAMRERGRGVIVNISSTSGRVAIPGLGAYAASKWALEGMSEALRHELRPFGVRVVLIEPGAYRTDILGRNRALSRRAEDPGPYKAMSDTLDTLSRRVASLASDPQEVADRIVAALEGRARALRYPMGRGVRPRIALHDWAPFGVLEAVVARLLRS